MEGRSKVGSLDFKKNKKNIPLVGKLYKKWCTIDVYYI
jgi:hypothetical protein